MHIVMMTRKQENILAQLYALERQCGAPPDTVVDALYNTPEPRTIEAVVEYILAHGTADPKPKQAGI